MTDQTDLGGKEPLACIFSRLRHRSETPGSIAVKQTTHFPSSHRLAAVTLPERTLTAGGVGERGVGARREHEDEGVVVL